MSLTVSRTSKHNVVAVNSVTSITHIGLKANPNADTVLAHFHFVVYLDQAACDAEAEPLIEGEAAFDYDQTLTTSLTRQAYDHLKTLAEYTAASEGGWLTA